MKWNSCTHCLNCWFELKCSVWFLTWTISSVNDLNFIPAKLCLIYDGGLMQMSDVWTIDELNHRHHCLNFERWTKCLNCCLNWECVFLPIVWLSTWTVISERSMNWSVIPEQTFDRWFELLFPRNYWTVIPERTFECWSNIPAKVIDELIQQLIECLKFYCRKSIWVLTLPWMFDRSIFLWQARLTCKTPFSEKEQ